MEKVCSLAIEALLPQNPDAVVLAKLLYGSSLATLVLLILQLRNP